MTKREVNELKAFVLELQRMATNLEIESSDEYELAGYSYDNGTGDEGWRNAFIKAGTAVGLHLSAKKLFKYVEKKEKQNGLR